MAHYFSKMLRLLLHIIVQTHKQIELSRKEHFGEVMCWLVSSTHCMIRLLIRTKKTTPKP